MRRAARSDLNQDEIELALERVGAEVASLAGLGNGKPDILVCFRRRLYLLEVKSRKGKLTKAQVVFHLRWPVTIVRSVDEALRAIGASR